ncbi:MAG: response regulator [Bacteroidales bacterium]|nr:response regulator [Bacteroidales bacterium]
MYKILYLDDEEVNLRLFKNIFRRDFEIFLANSAKEGLDFLENNNVDVVITDQMMPNMTGVELLEKINERFESIPPNRLILSGYSSNEDIEKAYKHYRLFRFISKPWNYEELKELIFKAIQQRYER